MYGKRDTMNLKAILLGIGTVIAFLMYLTSPIDFTKAQVGLIMLGFFILLIGFVIAVLK